MLTVARYGASRTSVTGVEQQALSTLLQTRHSSQRISNDSSYVGPVAAKADKLAIK